MQSEKRLWLAVLLLAVAQQDANYVRWLGARPTQAKRQKTLIAAEARTYVASDKFTTACQRINIEPERLRRLEPKEAFDAYQRITSDDFEYEVGKDLNELS